MKPLLTSLTFFLFVTISICQTVCDPDSLNSNDDFPGCTLCRGGSYEGSTNGKTTEPIDFDFPCGEIENSQWFTFTPDSTGLFFDIQLLSGLKGIEIGLFDNDLELVGDCHVLTERDTFIYVYSRYPDLKYYQPYYLMIDGIEGDSCEFRFFFESNLNPIGRVELGDIQQYPEGEFCPGEEVLFTVRTNPLRANYNWEVFGSLEVIEGGGSLDTFVRVLALDEGVDFGGIEVAPYNVCGQGPKYKDYFDTPKYIYTNLGDKYFCIEDRDSLPEDSCIIIDNGCDSCFNYRFIRDNSYSSTKVSEVICSETCYVNRDSCYYGDTIHTIVYEDYYPNGCDSVVYLDLKTISVFPSPLIDYTSVSSGILVEWDSVNSAERYDVFIDRDSFASTLDTFFWVPNFLSPENLNIKIQPKGPCSYLPAEITINPISFSSESFIANRILLLPNPTDGLLNIKSDLSIEQTEIYDLTGRLIAVHFEKSFSLEKETAGIYFLKIKTNEGIYVKRIFKTD